MMRKKSGKISLLLSKESLRGLNTEVNRVRKLYPGTVVSRSEVVREIISQYLLSQKEDRELEARTHTSVVHEATELRENGDIAFTEGGYRRARKLFLQSAAKELEALSFIDDPDESIMRTTLIEVVVLLKKATGYTYLPDIPSRPKIKVIESD